MCIILDFVFSIDLFVDGFVMILRILQNLEICALRLGGYKYQLNYVICIEICVTFNFCSQFVKFVFANVYKWPLNYFQMLLKCS